MSHALQQRKILVTGVVIVALVAFVATLVSVTALYRQSLETRREHLLDTSRTLAEWIALAARDVGKGNGGTLADVLAQLPSAHGLGESGEVQLARLDPREIEFMLPPRTGGDPVHLALDSPLGAPMRAALAGGHGTMEGLDYRGVPTLAAYVPVPALNAGLVVKMDMAEIRAPFMQAALAAGGAALLLSVLAALLFRRATSPLIHALIESEHHYRTLFALSPYGIAILEPDTLRILSFNTTAHEQLDYTREEFASLDFTDIEADSDDSQARAKLAEVMQSGHLDFATRHITRRGDIRHMHVHARPILSERRHLIYAILRDVTTQVHAHEELVAHREHLEELVQERTRDLAVANLQLEQEVAERRRAEDKLKLADIVFRTTMQGVFVTDTHGTILMVNPAFTAITGHTAEEAVGANPRILKSMHQDRSFYERMWAMLLSTGKWQGEIWNRRKNGEAYLQSLTITMFPDENGQPLNYVSVFSDITELHEKERHIRHQAYHDALTDLPNRMLFHDRLEQALARATRLGDRLAVLFFDLDRFKYVNDTLGHNVGDQLLQAVAQRITGSLRESDTISRFGGDEFVVLLTGVKSEQAVETVAAQLVQAFAQPFHVEHRDLAVTTSIGVAVYPGDGSDAATLLKNADAAMYRAKERGRNAFQFYTPDMNLRALAHLTLESELRRALDRNEFEVHYQPRVRVLDGQIYGAEALVRWRHPERGLVSPGEFIPIAEESGLIVPLGEWVLRAACLQATQWMASGERLRVSVNMSARQLNQIDLVDRIDAILGDTGLEGDRLELELTETLVMQQPETTIALLKALKERGISVAIDDFGTGYSSLSYLKRFPIDVLKIDQSFVREIPADADGCAIAEAITNLGRSLRMEVLAEGVETRAQLDFLAKVGCHAIQGYYFSRPLPADVFTRLLAEGRSLHATSAAGA